MLLVASAIKLVCEIALMAMAGQWLLGLLAGARREQNFAWRLLKILTDPFVRGARFISPRVVLDRHLPLVAFLVLAFAWIAATAWRISMCLEIGVELCR